MKYLIILFLFILTLSCQNNQNPNLFIGTWSKCNQEGEYFEWKIEENYILMMNSLNNDIAVFENKIYNNSLIIEGVNVSLPNEIDTLVLVSRTENKIVLIGGFGNQIIELNKNENVIGDIDSTNIEIWKNQTILKFRKRAELKNCHDLRTESEKIIDTLWLNPIEEIEIPIEVIKGSFN